MEPKYSRKSITNSYAERKSIDRNAIIEKGISLRTKWLANFRLNWDKYVYTFCLLYNYLSYVIIQIDQVKSSFVFVVKGSYQQFGTASTQ